MLETFDSLIRTWSESDREILTAMQFPLNYVTLPALEKLNKEEMDQFLDFLGAEWEDIKNPNKTINGIQVRAVIESSTLGEGRDEPLSMIAKEYSHLATYGVYGLAAGTAPTLWEAFNLSKKYGQLVNPALEISEVIEGPNLLVKMRIHPALGLARPMLVELSAMVAQEVLNGAEQPVAASSVHFSHASEYPLHFFETLFRCPVHFGAPENVVVFPLEVLNLPLKMHDPATHQLLVDQLEAQLQQVQRQKPWTQKVMAMIKQSLSEGDIVRKSTAAEKLFITERTLTRKLQKEGASYSQLLDQCRLDMARTLITEGALSFCEIAYLLGFTEVRTFHRAVKRWTGQTPGQLRDGGG